jgi:Domain of unknown function (DUF4157)
MTAREDRNLPPTASPDRRAGEDATPGTDGPVWTHTLGVTLDRAGRRLSSRYQPEFPWATGLLLLMARTHRLSAHHGGRFEREEVAPDGSRATEPPHLAGVTTALSDAGAPSGRHGEGEARTRAASPRPTAESGPRPARGPAEAVDPGRPLPDDVRGRLRPLAGRGADELRVHVGRDAEEVARAHRADAVTLGRHVYFAAGRFAPHERRGFGLLVHEATHVEMLLRPDSAARRSSDEGAGEEERVALVRERAAGGGDPGPHLVAAGRGPASVLPVPPRHRTAAPAEALRADEHPATGAPLPVSPAATRPMAAAADRVATTAEAPGVDVEALKRDLVEDLMRRLRTEFERGG